MNEPRVRSEFFHTFTTMNAHHFNVCKRGIDFPFAIKALIITLCLAILTASCSQETKFENFNSAKWKLDKMGCKKSRLDMLESLYEIQDQLRGLKHDEIIRLLGQPDATELYERGQRFYRYHISPSSKCAVQSESQVDQLEVRFNALGYVSEVNITIALPGNS